MSTATLYVIPAHAGIHPLPISTVLDPDPVSSTGWHFRRDDSCLHVIPAHAGIHPLPISTVLDPGPVSSTG